MWSKNFVLLHITANLTVLWKRSQYLYSRRERLQSIVMSVSVCVCVCASICLRGYLRNHKCDLYQICCAYCLWPWLDPPPAGWWNLKGKRQLWGFSFPIDNALYRMAIGTHTKRLNWSSCHLGWWVGLTRGRVCYVGMTIPEGEGAILGDNMCPKSLSDTPVNYELDWYTQQRAHDRGRHLIASIGRVYCRPRRGIWLPPIGKVWCLRLHCLPCCLLDNHLMVIIKCNT